MVFQDLGGDAADPCGARPKVLRYKVYGLFFALLGLACGLLALVGAYYLLDSMWGGYTIEAASGLVIGAVGGLGFFGLARFMFRVMPQRDALRMRDLREACLWFVPATGGRGSGGSENY